MKDGYRSSCKQCLAEAAGRTYRPRERLPEGKKRCRVCKQVLPATSESFKVDKRTKDGLGTICKPCAAASTRRYYGEHAAERRAYSIRRHYANREQELERMRARYQANKSEHYRKAKLWREANRERVRQLEHERYLTNREIILNRSRLWRKNNYERYREYNRQWTEANPEKVAAIRTITDTRRRSRKRGLPLTFTIEAWERCLDYWGFQCAVCDERNDLHADHWIPLNNPNSPGTVAENMVCLCSHCNHTKSARSAAEWLADKLGSEAAAQKLQEIERYFAWVRESDLKDGE
jgi:5-methylcytosine-specific restriction endonuclease McrA